jgi:hypothetical protein
MRNFLLVIGLTSMVVGCSSEAERRMTGEGPPPPWEALQAFEGEPLMSVGYPLERGDLATVKNELTGEKFSAALAAFEQSPLPDAYSTKQPDKDAMVKAWRDAIAAAPTAKPDELKEKVQAAITATNALHAK